MAENVKIGIQMYTLREFGDKDLPGTLEGVKRLGYDAVEFAGYNGLAADELKRLCNELGLAIISTHYSLDNFENSIEDAVAYHKALGLPFLAIPWMAADRGPGGEKYEETKALIEASAAALKEAGIQMLYHNHDFEFTALEDGTLAIDRLYQDIPDLLPEFDTCWVKYAGYDPVKYINAYKGRTPVIHLKDYVGHKDTKPAYALIDKDGKAVGGDEAETKTFAFRPVGQGIQDIPAIVRAGIASGCGAFIVEQDDCYGDAWGAAEQSLQYLRSIGL